MITDDQAKANISANLSRILRERGMSQPDLAAKTGIPVMTINRVIRRIHVPSSAYLARISEALDVSMDRLIAPPPAPFVQADSDHPQENLSKTP